ncbi:pollen allergen Phl p 2-like [Oryza brachyantha]|uniref:Expansin-like CBD domain-containing protein n=1 Tax=Oryza brachyantha TaxID=4533 RepID=J3MGK2_ORYBR|nr:pollen allergen Phl p 2-like [Oryza brachyantha]
MASSPYLLVAATLVAHLVVASCATELTFTVSSSTSLTLVTKGAVSEVEIKEQGANEWTSLKESPANTWTFDSKATLKGPISVRFLVKNGGYRVIDNIIPAEYDVGSVYRSSV